VGVSPNTYPRSNPCTITSLIPLLCCTVSAQGCNGARGSVRGDKKSSPPLSTCSPTWRCSRRITRAGGAAGRVNCISRRTDVRARAGKHVSLRCSVKTPKEPYGSKEKGVRTLGHKLQGPVAFYLRGHTLQGKRESQRPLQRQLQRQSQHQRRAPSSFSPGSASDGYGQSGHLPAPPWNRQYRAGRSDERL
jgi:hypothetical protein